MGLGSARYRRPVAGLVGALAVLAAVAAAPAAQAAVPSTSPNDPLFAKQWGLSAVGAPSAWFTSTGAGELIGVVDTGVDLSHQDLAGQVVASTDCVGSGGNPLDCHGSGQDDNGHGTEVAGVAAAATNNAVGIAGAAPGAHLLVAKVLTGTGKGSIEDINAGIEWVVRHGAQIVNISLGDPTFTFTSLYGASLREGIEYAWSKGAVPVLAAGNATALGLDPTAAGSLDAVVVGATGRSGTPAPSTTPTGDAKWAVMAPGGSADGVQSDDVLSTNWVAGQPNSYGYLSGTAMAAPLVSGTLALLLADGLSPQGAVDRLLATAVSPTACGDASSTCRGIVAASVAMSGLAPAPPPSTTVAPASVPGTPPPSTPPTTRAPRPAPAPSPVVSAAAPAVMRPAAPTRAPTPSTTVAPTAGATTTQPPATAPGRVLVGLAATDRGRTAPADLTWFALLAGVFVLLFAAGIVRVMRAPPPEGLE